MFIHVTRHGSERVLRLTIAAIAYVEDVSDGSVIRLIGGEGLRVTESVSTIETARDAVVIAPVHAEQLDLTPGRFVPLEEAPAAAPRPMVAADFMLASPLEPASPSAPASPPTPSPLPKRHQRRRG